MYYTAPEGISIFTFWKDIDYPEDFEIRDYEIHVFHNGKYLIYPLEVFNCMEKIPPYKSTDKIGLWYHGDSYTTWLFEYEHILGHALTAESYMTKNGNFRMGYNILTYKKLVDYLHIQKMLADGLIPSENCRIVRETELWAFCFDALQESLIQIDGQDSYCLFETGGNIVDVIETGGLAHNVRESDFENLEVVDLKNSDTYPLMVRGSTNLFKAINKSYNSLLLSIFPFTISVYLWNKIRLRDSITIVDNLTRPFKVSEVIDCSNCIIELRIDNYKTILLIENYFGYKPNIIKLTVVDDLEKLHFCITDVDKCVEKEIPFPQFVKAI